MFDIEFTGILYRMLVSQVLNLVMDHLSKSILLNSKKILLENLSNYDIINNVLGIKKNTKIYISNYNLKDTNSIIPNFYRKLYKYLDSKKLISDIKIKNKKVKGFMDDIKIKINENLYIEISNIVNNNLYLESRIEIYSTTNDFDLDKFIKKIENIK